MVFPGALGDFLCFLPALRFISERERESDLEIAMRSEFSELLFPRTPPISVRSLDCHEIGRLFATEVDLDQGLRAFLRSYAFIYSWMGARQPQFVRNLQALYEGDLRIFPFYASQARMHMMDYYLSCLDERDPVKNYPAIPLRFAAIAWCRRFWEQAGLKGKRVLALGLGSGAKEKNWPLPFFRTISRWWEERTEGRSLVVFGPVEEERMAGQWSWEDSLVVRGLGLGQVAALLAKCDLYLGNDSGLTHLAAVLGVETVAIFGPTDPFRWRPRGKKVSVITPNMDCSPCNPSTMKACAYQKCVWDLRPSHLIAFLEKLLPGIVLDKEWGTDLKLKT
ncbi:MAG: glycosyltransferase family 9 protein [Candidatus Binatia bacterium]